MLGCSTSFNHYALTPLFARPLCAAAGERDVGSRCGRNDSIDVQFEEAVLPKEPCFLSGWYY